MRRTGQKSSKKLNAHTKHTKHTFVCVCHKNIASYANTKKSTLVV